jgi:hypothetical protein
MHTDVCEQPVTDDRTVHRRVRNLVRKTVASTTGDLMRTDPRGFPSWPEAVTASRRGRIHYRGRFFTDDSSLRIRAGPYIFAEDSRLISNDVGNVNVYAGELEVSPPDGVEGSQGRRRERDSRVVASGLLRSAARRLRTFPDSV